MVQKRTVRTRVIPLVLLLGLVLASLLFVFERPPSEESSDITPPEDESETGDELAPLGKGEGARMTIVYFDCTTDEHVGARMRTMLADSVTGSSSAHR